LKKGKKKSGFAKKTEKAICRGYPMVAGTFWLYLFRVKSHEPQANDITRFNEKQI
jgi:hypothetical protein